MLKIRWKNYVFCCIDIPLYWYFWCIFDIIWKGILYIHWIRPTNIPLFNTGCHLHCCLGTFWHFCLGTVWHCCLGTSRHWSWGTCLWTWWHNDNDNDSYDDDVSGPADTAPWGSGNTAPMEPAWPRSHTAAAAPGSTPVEARCCKFAILTNLCQIV